jgi:hypothetical protein
VVQAKKRSPVTEGLQLVRLLGLLLLLTKIVACLTDSAAPYTTDKAARQQPSGSGLQHIIK